MGKCVTQFVCCKMDTSVGKGYTPRKSLVSHRQNETHWSGGESAGGTLPTVSSGTRTQVGHSLLSTQNKNTGGTHCLLSTWKWEWVSKSNFVGNFINFFPFVPIFSFYINSEARTVVWSHCVVYLHREPMFCSREEDSWFLYCSDISCVLCLRVTELVSIKWKSTFMHGMCFGLIPSPTEQKTKITSDKQFNLNIFCLSFL